MGFITCVVLAITEDGRLGPVFETQGVAGPGEHQQG